MHTPRLDIFLVQWLILKGGQPYFIRLKPIYIWHFRVAGEFYCPMEVKIKGKICATLLGPLKLSNVLQLPIPVIYTTSCKIKFDLNIVLYNSTSILVAHSAFHAMHIGRLCGISFWYGVVSVRCALLGFHLLCEINVRF